MLTMLLGGLWHGAAWTFVVWGGDPRRRACASSARCGWQPTSTARAVWLGRLLTFHVVCFAWIFFRADSFARAWQVIERLFTAWGQPSPLVTTSVVLAIAVGIGGQYRPARRARRPARRLPAAAGRRAGGMPRPSSLLVINTLGPEGVAPFIYFRF